jgi:hypothetical protein
MTLRDETDTLREELRQAQCALVGNDGWLPLVVRLRLARKPEILLRTLYKHNLVTREMMRVALNLVGSNAVTSDSYQRDHAILTILRRTLPPGSILCLSGRGHYLSQQGREWIRKQLAD